MSWNALPVCVCENFWVYSLYDYLHIYMLSNLFINFSVCLPIHGCWYTIKTLSCKMVIHPSVSKMPRTIRIWKTKRMTWEAQSQCCHIHPCSSCHPPTRKNCSHLYQSVYLLHLNKNLKLQANLLIWIYILRLESMMQETLLFIYWLIFL